MITINQWLVSNGYNPEQSELGVQSGRLLMPKSLWDSTQVAPDADLTVVYERQ